MKRDISANLYQKCLIPSSKILKIENYTAKVGQDNVNIGVVTIFRLANTSLLQVY